MDKEEFKKDLSNKLSHFINKELNDQTYEEIKEMLVDHLYTTVPSVPWFELETDFGDQDRTIYIKINSKYLVEIDACDG